MSRALAALALIGGCATVPSRSWKATPAPHLDERFFPVGHRWRGGDAIYSVPLSSDRVLWLFGDSFIAQPGVDAREGARMIRNSLAVETVAGALDFFWRTENGEPADAIPCPVKGQFFWPLSGLRAGPRLYLFLYRVRNKGEGAFGFETAASHLAVVDNPEAPPGRWAMTLRDVPESFGTASLLLDGFAYLYGIRKVEASAPTLSEAIVARVPEDSIDDVARWRYWNGRDWERDRSLAKGLFTGAATEMSVSFLAARGRLVAVSSGPLLSPEIRLVEAPRPEGPWGAPIVVYTCPEPEWKKGYFCYAAKGHPEADPSGRTLLVSYACNAMSFADAVRDRRIYRPRFLVLTFD